MTDFAESLHAERVQVQLFVPGSGTGPSQQPSVQSIHTQTVLDLFSVSRALHISSPSYAEAAASPGRQTSTGVGGWRQLQYPDFPLKPQDDEENASRKDSQSGSRGLFGGIFNGVRGDSGVSKAQYKRAEQEIHKLDLDLKRSSEECDAHKVQVKKLQHQVEDLKTEGKRCRAALEKHMAKLEASEAHAHNLASSHASKEAAWQEEVGVLNERCAEASFSKDLLENDLWALKEEIDHLRALLPGSDVRASAACAEIPGNPVLSFENGFGSIEQRAILESIALHVDVVARMLLECRMVDVPKLLSFFFSAGPRSFVDLNYKQGLAAQAALQHFLVDNMLAAAFRLEWPDIAALDGACQISREPGVAASGQQLQAAMFRAWYLVACEAQAEQQGKVSSPATVDFLHQQASQLADSIFPNIQQPAIHSGFLGLAFDFVKLRLLVGSLQLICPGIKVVFKREPGPFDPEICDEPLLNLLAQPNMADAGSRFIIFCLRPGLAYPGKHNKLMALVKQQVVTLMGTI